MILTLTASSDTATTSQDLKQQQTDAKSYSAQTPPAETVHTTFNHPWLTTDRGWIDAGNLRLGEQVQRLDGTTATVTQVTLIPGAQDMYDLTVSNLHTFVVGIIQAVVHNCSGTALGKAMTQAGKLMQTVNSQAHHLIPCQLTTKNDLVKYAIQHGVFNPDEAANGTWLPNLDSAGQILNTVAHRGPHKAYTSYIDGMLNIEFDTLTNAGTLNPSSAQAAILTVQKSARQFISTRLSGTRLS